MVAQGLPHPYQELLQLMLAAVVVGQTELLVLEVLAVAAMVPQPQTAAMVQPTRVAEAVALLTSLQVGQAAQES